MKDGGLPPAIKAKDDWRCLYGCWRCARRRSPASNRRLSRGAGNAGNGGAYKVAKGENAVAGVGIACRHPYRAGHFRHRWQSPFHIWGDAVNTASFMEAHCPPGQINISETVAAHAKALFELEPRGTIKAKHERPYRMFFLNRPKPEFSSDTHGRAPNENFSADLEAAEQSIAVLGSRIAVS
jgi:class 3 adenylate cyclase